jgi:CRISPR system Cascade subunit CasE
VQSAQRPDWDYAFQNAPYLLAESPKLREFDPIPKLGQAYRFRLLANVIQSRSVAHADGTMRNARPIPRRRRTEVPIRPVALPAVMPAEAAERERLLCERWDPWRSWLQRMGESRGFRVLHDGASPLLMQAVHSVVQYPHRADGNNGHGAREKRYNAGLFNGTLTCTSAGELRSAIVNGVGHAKAFGFGLLSVAPVGNGS